MTKTPTIFVLSGPPGSGKTTWAKKQKIPTIHIDIVRKNILGKWAINPTEEIKEKAFNIAIKQANKYISQGISFIWDGTNIKKDRLALITSLENNTCCFIAVVFTTPLAECLVRNKSRSGEIDESIITARYHALTEEPAQNNEGFDEVVYI